MFRDKLHRPAIIGATTIGLVISSFGGVALAESLFIRDRNISVLERERPGYEAEGLRTGQFIIKPKVDVGVGYSSNVFALSDVDAALGFDVFEDESDVYAFARPSVRFESDWSRHAIAGGAYVEAVRFNEFDEESMVDWGAYLDGQIDVTEFADFFGGLSYDRLNESRRSYNSAFLFDEPINYTQGEIYGGYRQEFGRVKIKGQLGAQTRDYDDAQVIPLVVVTPGLFFNADQDFRDRTAITALGEVAFAVTRDTAVYFEAQKNWQDFDGTDAVFRRERDSNGYRVTGGVDFDLTKLMRGRVGIGYFSQEFDDPTYDEISGVAIDAALEWFPSDLTTVTLTADRGVDNSAIISSAGYISSDVMIQLDHELRRNVILSGFAAFGRDEYDDPLLNGMGMPVMDVNGNPVSQEIDRFGVGLGADYYMNRTFSVGVDYTYETQDVARTVFDGGFDTNFDVHQVLITATFKR
ncbi:outer membrane beta-barrel protein [Parvularcula marina]|uniref:outer membrane beta-barrel protein n=1 Tax=Parvularcula marina TaxID=2292771 RepID=UPI0013148E45|nr:outer membrane beta-barrel protein [Parvularcula marina]